MEGRRRVVVKIGSSSVTDSNGRMDEEKLAGFVSHLQEAASAGLWQLILVTSGAIAAGTGKLGWNRQTISLPEQQAAAAVGQGLLMQTYSRHFGLAGTIIGQVLLTRFDIDDPKRVSFICNTMETLLAHGVVPVVNENDTVAVDEIRVGENDTLAARVAVLVSANLLVLLTDVDGFYTADPRLDPEATAIRDVWDITEELTQAAGAPGSAVGTGGMQTKLQAADIATQAGIDTVVAKSGDAALFAALANGQWKGTMFHAKRAKAVFES